MNAILSSVAFLETTVNEVFQDAHDNSPSRIAAFTPGAHGVMLGIWALSEEDGKHSKTLSKYQLALRLAGQTEFLKGEDPYQSAALLIELRNFLTHYKPKSLGIGEAARLTNAATGEGISYAMRSARVAAEAITDNPAPGQILYEDYTRRTVRSFTLPLQTAIDTIVGWITGPSTDSYTRFGISGADLGIVWDNGQVVWDTYNPHPEFEDVIRPELVFIGTKSGSKAPFGKGSVISDGLQELLLLFSGTIRQKEGATNREFIPLMRTSPNSGVLEWSDLIEEAPAFFGMGGPRKHDACQRKVKRDAEGFHRGTNLAGKPCRFIVARALHPGTPPAAAGGTVTAGQRPARTSATR